MGFMKKHLIWILAATATSAYAMNGDLTVTNSTKQLISVRLNGHCSKDFGVINRNTSAVVSERNLNNYCQTNKSHCLAQVFSSKNCDKIAVGHFYFNTSSGTSGEGSAVGRYSMEIKQHQVIFYE